MPTSFQGRIHFAGVLLASAALCCSPSAHKPSGEQIGPTAERALSTDPTAVGAWSDPFVLDTGLPATGQRDGHGPIVPIHMVMLKNRHVLMFSRYADSNVAPMFPPDATKTTPEAYEWAPDTGTFFQVPCGPTSLFCSGHSQLADGRLLDVGGHVGIDEGVPDANILTPGVGWASAPPMQFDRWYPSSIALPTGEALVAGGTFGGVDDPRTTSEVFQTNNTWRQLSGLSAISWFKYYPWNHVLSDGVVFYTGATNTTQFINTAGTGSFTNGPSRANVLRDYGTSVMYDRDKILVAGGGSPPQNTAGKIDVSPANRATASWQPTPMTYPRKLHNATILPNGQVFVSGGTTQGGNPGGGPFEETGLEGGPVIIGDTGNKGLQIAVAPFSDGRVDVYMIGLDHVVWHMWQDASLTWHYWTQVGDRTADEISVARLIDGSAELMMVDHSASHNLWHVNVAATGTSGSFLQLGDNSNQAKHVAIAPFQNGQLDCYMVGLDNVMWHMWRDTSAAWHGWTAIGSLTAFSVAANAGHPMWVARRPDDTSEVVMMDGNQNLWHDWLSPATASHTAVTDHGFALIGNTSNRALQIAVAPYLDGRLDVYMIGLDSHVWRIGQTTASSSSNVGGTWMPGFVPIGTDQANALAPVRLADGHADVFIVATADGLVYHTNGDNSPTYPSAWAVAPGICFGGANNGASCPSTPCTAPGVCQRASGTFKRAFLRSDGTPNDPNAATQLVVVPYLNVINGVRLDSRAAVVALGADQNMRLNYQENAPVFASELWDPVTSSWTTTASMQVPRTYHSTAILLPNAQVLSAGGGAGGNEPDHPNAEIYSPPYLFRGIQQPDIPAAPATLHYGATSFSVTTSAIAANISAVTLLGLSSTTHSFNMGQHFNSLSYSISGTQTLNVTPPANANVTPPGWYMLFVLDRGVPSLAAMVQVAP